jgi:probable HAF family extracellular repeat protein
MKQHSAVLIALILVLGALSSVYAAGYTYTPLNYPGATSTFGVGINDTGTVVGYYGTTGSSTGFSLSGGTYASLSYEGYSTEAHGVNNAGTIVGLYENSEVNNGYSLSGTTYTSIIYEGSTSYSTSVYGINNNGTVVGWYSSNGGQNYGFSFNGTTYAPINPFPATTTKSRAEGINDSGTIVGYYKDASGVTHGFSYSGENYTTINYPGASGTQALGINNGNVIVGMYTDSAGTHGFSYSGGNYTAINYPGASATEATGINNSGVIVGTYEDASGNYHGFMATPAAGLASGWNLISLPAQPASTAIATVLSGLAGSYEVVWAYPNQAWKVYDPNDTAGSTLTSMQAGIGYWIKMTSPGTLSVTGGAVPSSLSLLSGWNLVGYNGTSCGAPSTALSSLGGALQVSWGYPGGVWLYYDPANSGSSSLTQLCPGAGYWIYVNQAGAWTPPASPQQAAITGITATLTSFANTVNQKGANLQGSNLAPYVDPNYLNDGQNAAYCASNLASFLASNQAFSFTGLQINSFDGTNNVAGVSFQITQGAQSQTVSMIFKLLSGSWLITGDNQVAATEIMTQAWDWGTGYANENQPSQYTQTTSLIVQDVLRNNVASVTVSGPGITGSVSVPMTCSYNPADCNGGACPVCANSHDSSSTQRYFEYDFSYWPAVGGQYTFTLTMASGGTYSSGGPYTYTAAVGTEYGFDSNGNPVAADYPVITLTGSSSSLSFSQILNGGPVTVTGTVYIPSWSATGIDQLHFNLEGPGGTSTNASNVDITGTWNSTPVAGQTNAFTMKIPAVTMNGPPYLCEGAGNGTCYNVTFQGQTGNIQTGGWFGFNANSHGTGFTHSGLEVN